jgi:hypothetical protein
VLPQLLALFGADLAYQRPPPPDLDRLRGLGIFGRLDAARADDAIAGAYRGLRIAITQLRVVRGWALGAKTVFRGLLFDMDLTQRLSGVTVVAADEGAFGNLKTALMMQDFRRVGLESPVFERDYEVYATDQVMARALLTPLFMERFRALGQGLFARPLALARASQLILALPGTAATTGYGRASTPLYDDFFRPPDFDEPAADDALLERLHHDIEAILAAADAVIGLEGAQATTPSRKRRSRKAD